MQLMFLSSLFDNQSWGSINRGVSLDSNLASTSMHKSTSEKLDSLCIQPSARFSVDLTEDRDNDGADFWEKLMWLRFHIRSFALHTQQQICIIWLVLGAIQEKAAASIAVALSTLGKLRKS